MKNKDFHGFFIFYGAVYILFVLTYANIYEQ